MTPYPDQPENEDKLDSFLKPKIYSRRAVRGFSIFFSPIFGGVLLWQNLRAIEKRREAGIVLAVSILLTVFPIALVMLFNIQNRYVGIILNIAGAVVMAEYFYRKYFPDESTYPNKAIWKPLIIGLVILVLFVWLVFVAPDQAAN